MPGRRRDGRDMEFTTRALLAVGLLVVGVGVIDAGVTQSWDLLTILAALGAIIGVLLVRTTSGRVPTELRPDLAKWIEHRAEKTGEPFEDLLDRAVAAYRSELFDDPL